MSLVKNVFAIFSAPKRSQTRSRRAPSLQRRLALGVSAALGLILVLLAIALDEVVDHQLHAYMDDSLRKRANAIVTFIQTQPQRIGLLNDLMTEYQRSSHTDFFEVRDAQGDVLLRSDSITHDTPMHPPTWPVTEPLYYDQNLPDGHQGRALAQSFDAVVGGGTRRLTLVVASERAFEDQLETAIDYALGVGVVLALVLTLIVALWAVRRGLAPVLRAGELIAHRDGRLPSTAVLEGVLLPRELQPFAQALEDAFARLHAAIERERSFSSNVAHELRTPLAEIRAATEVAARAPGDTQAAEAAFATSLGAVERMQRAIDTLLLLTRCEAGLTTLALDPLDLPALLDTLLDAHAPLAAQRGVALERAYRPGNGEVTWVRSDVGALERIVSNLLGNAIAYAPEGSRVDVRVQTEEGGAVALSVSNLAPDLTPADLAHLSERFWRKSSGGSTAAHAGLGLALASALARSLGLRMDFALADGWLTVRVAGLAGLAGL
jgi:two-component system sensor histidine kinase QseC